MAFYARVNIRSRKGKLIAPGTTVNPDVLGVNQEEFNAYLQRGTITREHPKQSFAKEVAPVEVPNEDDPDDTGNSDPDDTGNSAGVLADAVND